MRITTELKNVIASKIVDAYNKKYSKVLTQVIKTPEYKALVKDNNKLAIQKAKLEVQIKTLDIITTKNNNKLKELAENNGLNFNQYSSQNKLGIFSFQPTKIQDLSNSSYSYTPKARIAFNELMVQLQMENLDKNVLKRISEMIEETMKNI